VLLSERFEMASSGDGAAGGASLAEAVPVPATPLVGRDGDAAAAEPYILHPLRVMLAVQGSKHPGCGRADRPL